MTVVRGRFHPAYYAPDFLQDKDEYSDADLIALLSLARDLAKQETALFHREALRIYVWPIEIELERRRVEYAP